MNTNIITLVCFFFAISTSIAQSPVGVWKTIDDESGKARSYIEIYEKNNAYYGKITKLLIASPDTKCTACEGDKKNQPLIGMDIIWGLKEKSYYWGDGEIMDPQKGKTYNCYIELEAPNKLKVRGYLGVSLLGRTQYWYRVDSSKQKS